MGTYQERLECSVNFISSDCMNISIVDQNVILEAPPGGALTLTLVPLTLLPKASKVSATLPWAIGFEAC